jgi:hypothetical protein
MTAPRSEATLHHAGLYRAVPAPSLRMLKDPLIQHACGNAHFVQEIERRSSIIGAESKRRAVAASMQTCVMPGFPLTCLVPGIKIAFAPTSLG